MITIDPLAPIYVGGAGEYYSLPGATRSAAALRHPSVAERIRRALFSIRTHRLYDGRIVDQRDRAVARVSARCSTRASPSSPRSRRSRPAIGTRFCGARGSLYADEANRGNVAPDRSASSIACPALSSGEHSTRTIPAHGA